MRRQRPKAFTLIEIIIVIVVIGILATLAGVVYSGMLEKGASEEAKMGISAILSAEEIYRINSGNYLEADSNGTLNTDLQLSLQTDSARKWNYSTTAASGPTPRVCVQAARVGKTCVWTQCSDQDDPSSSNCP